MLHQRDPLQAERKARDLSPMARQQRELSNVGVWVGVLNVGQLKEYTHSVAYRALQRSVLFGLAADVVEGEQQMVIVSQIGRNLHLHLLIKLRRPFERELNTKFKEDTVKEDTLDRLQWKGKQ